MKCPRCRSEMVYQVLSDVMVCPTCGQVAAADETARERAGTVAILRAALQFYADESSYQGARPILADGGRLAREALTRTK